MLGIGNTLVSINPGALPDVFGNDRGGSVIFDGTDDYIDYGQLTRTQLTSLESSGTLAVWFHIDGDSAGSSVQLNVCRTTDDYVALWWHNYFNEPRATIKGGGTGKGSNPNNGVFGTGTNNGTSNYITAAGWYFHAMTYVNSSEGYVKHHGENLSGTLITTTLNLTAALDMDLSDATVWVGARNNAGAVSTDFEGLVSYAAIWDTALDSDAITALYNSGTPIDATKNSGDYDNSANLIFFDNMQTGRGETSYVITGPNNGTLNNNATWSAVDPTD